MVKKIFFVTEDYYLLPKKYHLIHEYCFHLHDQLVKIVEDGMKRGVFNQKINIRFGMKYILYLRSNKYTNVINIRSLVAAYNAGTAKICQKYNPGKCYPGEYINYNHVNKVYRHYRYLKGVINDSNGLLDNSNNILPSSYVSSFKDSREYRYCNSRNDYSFPYVRYWLNSNCKDITY